MAEPRSSSDFSGGELVVRAPRGFGGVAVATDRMHHELERCTALVEAAAAALVHLAAARILAPAVPGITGTASAEFAEQRLLRARALAAELGEAVAIASAAYDEGEHLVERGQRAGAAFLAGLLGSAVRTSTALVLVGLLASPAAFGYVLSMLAAGWLNRDAVLTGAGGVLDWLTRNPQLITSPAFAHLVGLAATSADDAALGLLGLPPGLSLLLGEDALGLTGVPFGAGVVIAGAGLVGAARETDVRVWRSAPENPATNAPEGSADRLSRVPDGSAQLRIERYDAPGMPPRWIVYVGPTVDFALSGGEPFDMTSNMHAVAGGSPASLRALELALADAGVSAADEVQFVGFSQGGLIAARAVESGRWNAVALESYGAPIGGVDIPPAVTGLTVRHSDDLVPATGGPDAADSLVHVERRAFLPQDQMPAIAAPAHQRNSYLLTARLIDEAESGLLGDERERLTAFGADYLAAGGTVTTFEYQAERVAED